MLAARRVLGPCSAGENFENFEYFENFGHFEDFGEAMQCR